MLKLYKEKSERLQKQIDLIGKAYCEAPTDHDFAETVYRILGGDE